MGEHHVTLDTRWLEDAKDTAEMKMRRSELPTDPTIFKVPSSLRHYNQHDCEPKLISIGPFHRHKRDERVNLMAMEELKWRMLHHYLSMVPNGSKNEGLREMKNLEARARDCYSEEIDLGSDQFMEMLLLDGCFLVQIFIVQDSDDDEKEQTGQVRKLKSLLFDTMWFRKAIFRDLLLLENQIPYFIVEHLLDALNMPEWDSCRLQRAVIVAFIDFLQAYQNILPHGRHRKLMVHHFLHEQLDYELEVHHFLHLVHKWFSNFVKSNNRDDKSYWQLPSDLVSSIFFLTIRMTEHFLSKALPCCNNPLPLKKSLTTATTATELVEAGVKIKVRKESIFLDISFCKKTGVLWIPSINVGHDYINFFFVNLIAFEQCCPRYGLDVTHYITFLDNIVSTSRDVQLLCQEGIISRNIHDVENIASFFNRLGNGVTCVSDENYLTCISDENYLSGVRKDLNSYCQSRRNRWRAKLLQWRANLVRDYFSNPWSFISLVAAVLLIALTILQAVYAVLGYYKGNQQQ